MFRPAIRGEVTLERLHALAEDKGLRVIDFLRDAQDLVAERSVLLLQIEKRDRHGGGSVIDVV